VPDWRRPFSLLDLRTGRFAFASCWREQREACTFPSLVLRFSQIIPPIRLSLDHRDQQEENRFARDSSLEGGGFELLVPREIGR
jgi:hypothetical protein